MTTYEQMRDEATGDGAEAWRAADREEGRLRALYASLKEDPRYNNEYRSEAAWRAYEASKGKIAENKAKARELLKKRASSAEDASVPFPHGEGIVAADANKLIASQNEASRIVRRLDRMESGGKGPFKPDKLGALREEYGRGLETGDVQGAAVCRGVLSAADELGVDRHAVVDGFRKDRHRETLERAEHYARLSGLIGKHVPEPPFARPGSGKGSDFHTGRANSLSLDRGQTTEGSRRPGRRAPWK